MSPQKSNLKFAVLATDVALFSLQEGKLKVLLIKAKSKKFLGMPTLPGGLVGPKEKIEKAAERFIKRYTDPKGVYFEQLYTFGDPQRDPGGRVVSVAYLGLVPSAKIADISAESSWVSARMVPSLAYDHNAIVEAALERLRGKLSYTNIIQALFPEEFSLTELQEGYENILGRKLDKRNFRKRILSLGIVKKTEKQRKGEPNRPARIFRFVDNKIKVIEVL